MDNKEHFSIKKSLSVELLMKERLGSKNWGSKEIFSFYDGLVSPSLLVGQCDGRIYVYSRFENNEGQDWYRLFRTKHRFPKGKTHLVTVTFDESEKAIYIDGQLRNKKNVTIDDRAFINLSGSLLLGNSTRGKNGWSGEIKGIAIYNRILLPDEIVEHSWKIFQKICVKIFCHLNYSNICRGSFMLHN